LGLAEHGEERSATRGDVLFRVGDPRYPLIAILAPGVFAVGDVRSGSIKRCAIAVGEGAMVVAHLHAHLAGAETASHTNSGREEKP
jgi:hypothetical protein